MTTDVLERPDAATDEEERVYVTLTVADQLCGCPCSGCATSSANTRSRAFRWRRPRSPAASICAAVLSPRSTCGGACVCRRAPAGQPRMSVVAEQGGELYALLVDQVSEVMSLKASAFERNPPTLPPAWAQFSTGIYRLDGRLLVVLDVGKLLALNEAA